MAHSSNPTFDPVSRTLPRGKTATERSEGGGFRRESAGFLGTYAKSENKTRIDPETGEILGLIDPMESRVNRFILQQVARKLLPKTRTNYCLRLRQKGKQVEVWKSHEFKTASFVGLQTCGSVWACPVCAAKIAERRRAEVVAAMAAHKAAGGSVTLLTLTAPHQRTDNLADLLAKLKKALNSFKNDRHVKAIFKAMGIIGDIKALEVTHGRLSPSNNGWHPHYHILQFGGLGVDYVPLDWLQMVDMEDVLYRRWAAACVRAGLGEPSREHGLKLDDGSKAAKYVSKWGLEDEMTKGHTKKALHGETPFDFLRSYLADPNDKQAGALFREFAETFKGKRQLVWSRGLKKRYAIGELTDEELSAQTDDQARLLGQITLPQWCDVLAVEGRGVVLQLASSGGWEAVSIYLDSIKREPE
jgi:Replication protein